MDMFAFISEIISPPRRPLVFTVSSYALGIALCYALSPGRPAVLLFLTVSAVSLCLALLRGNAAVPHSDGNALRGRQTSPHRRDTVASDGNASSLIFAFLVAVSFFFGVFSAHNAFTQKDPFDSLMAEGEGTLPETEGRVFSASSKDGRVDYLILSGGSKYLVRDYSKKRNFWEYGDSSDIASGNASASSSAEGASTDYHAPIPDGGDLVGKRVVFRGELSYPQNAGNPGLFNYRLYLLSKNVRVIVTADSPPEISSYADTSFLSGFTESAYSAYAALSRLKEYLLSLAYGRLPPEQAALFSGMMFGDKSGMSDDLYSMFQRNGVAHILCVSGLHVGMVYAFVYRLLGNRKTTGVYVLILAVLLAYAAMSEFAPSVVRASLMISTHIFSRLLRKRYDPLTGIALSAFTILLINPLQLFSSGFLLSYTAVISLSFALPFTMRFTGITDKNSLVKIKNDEMSDIYHISRPKRVFAAIAAFFIPATVIQLTMAPITAFLFCYFSPTAVLLNIPVIALASVIVPLGICALLILAAGSGVALLLPALAGSPAHGAVPDLAAFFINIFLEACELLIGLMLRLTSATASLPFSDFNSPAPPVFFVFLFYLLGCYLASESFLITMARLRDAKAKAKAKGKNSNTGNDRDDDRCKYSGSEKSREKSRKKVQEKNNKAKSPGIPAKRQLAFSCIGLACICLALASNPSMRQSDAIYTFVDVGQGDCLHLRTPDGRNYLVDGGGKKDFDMGAKVLRPYLLKNGVTSLDGIFVSHLHEDHVGGLIQLAALMDTGPIYVFEESAGEAALLFSGSLKEAEIIPVSSGDVVVMGRDASAEILFPERMDEGEGASGAAAKKEEVDENLISLIMRFNCEGISALMTGDVGFPAEDALISKGGDISADILKVGHHGSKYSTSENFLEAVGPVLAVIQVGASNTYGHPTPETLVKLSEKDIITYRTDEDGAVMAGAGVKTAKRDFTSKILLKEYELKAIEGTLG
ncbi:MAG: ComEC/Rec2 family competence protein [Clostridiales Family XIII bacterium]|jgi:competence protein ComEC|nr:ComEC/Rec2 family competence protein [Clostridiales Family XIII bacterium]